MVPIFPLCLFKHHLFSHPRHRGWQWGKPWKMGWGCLFTRYLGVMIINLKTKWFVFLRLYQSGNVNTALLSCRHSRNWIYRNVHVSVKYCSVCLANSRLQNYWVQNDRISKKRLEVALVYITFNSLDSTLAATDLLIIHKDNIILWVFCPVMRGEIDFFPFPLFDI